VGFWIFVKKGSNSHALLTSWRKDSRRPILNPQKLERDHFATRAKTHVQNLASTHAQKKKKPLVMGAVVVIDDGPTGL
jgi:hypothetical protein